MISKTTGFPVLTIDRNRLIERMNAAFACVDYDLGSKPRLGSLPGAGFRKADCSGFVRWLIYAASLGKAKITAGGSVIQRQWCQQQGFKLTDYKHCALKDNRLRIAFMNPGGGEHGHVWLIINGQTIECYYGHGAGRREWDTSVLKKNVDYCFVLTDELK